MPALGMVKCGGERIQRGWKVKNRTAEDGAGSTPVVIMNGQLLLSKPPPHSPTSSQSRRRSHGEESSCTEIHWKHTETSEKPQHCSRFCLSPKNSQHLSKLQSNSELHWDGEQELQETIRLTQKFLTCKWGERESR